MVISFIWVWFYDSGLLQQVPVNPSAGDLTSPGKLDSNKLSKTRRIVVSDSLRITECFENRVRSQDLLRKAGKLLRP